MKVNSFPLCENCPCHKSTIFNSCKGEDLNYISGSKTFRVYKKGHVLFYEGDKSNGIYCIYSGIVKIAKTNREGKEQIIWLAKSGDNLGYHSSVSDRVHSDSAIVIEEASICFIPNENFNEVVSKNVLLNRELLRRLSVDFAYAEGVIKQMAFKPVRERLADALLLIHAAYIREDNNLKINISRGDIASLTGTAKETTARVLAEFKEAEIIHIDGRNIEIVNFEKLLSISKMYD